MKSKPTSHDGILFRSRTEAAWYEYFKSIGLRPVYEPETFMVGPPGSKVPYTPDFRIDIGDHGTFVEIKPMADNLPAEEFGKAYCCGYLHPTVLVMGWPLEYFACLIGERHKGCPDGFIVHFLEDEKRLFTDDPWCAAGDYPDENGLADARDPRLHISRWEGYVWDGGRLARAAWNATQWKPPQYGYRRPA